MNCSRCSSLNPEVARFCHKCGAVLIPEADRSDYYAAHPAESVRALALVSTLMPHISAHRHHIYRLGLGLAIGAALVASGFGILPVALICAGIALPGMLLTYFYDHEVWSDEPGIVLGVSIGLAGALGVGIGFLADFFSNNGLLIGFRSSLPDIGQLLEESVLLPAVALTALLVAPTLMTIRPKFKHAIDALTLCALAGAAYSLGETIVIQHGAFSSLTVHDTVAARDAFTALSLGFVKPVIYGTASALALMRVRRRTSWNIVARVIQSYLLIAAYDSSVATLSNFGQEGLVLNFVIASALAVIGLLSVRNEVHGALLEEAEEAAGVTDPSSHGGFCANCQLPLLKGASFCLACGTAVKAMPKQHQRALPSGLDESA